MDQIRLKSLVRELRTLTDKLESEIYSDTESYTAPQVKYEDVLEYFQSPASAEEGL
jgi:hypothetical protein